MARLWTAGAETKANTLESLTVPAGAVTYDTSTFRSGSVAFKSDSGAGNAANEIQSSGVTVNVVGRTYYARAYINYSSFPTANDVYVLYLGGTSFHRIVIDTDHKLYLEVSVGATRVGSASAALSTGTWYCVELAWKYDSGALDYGEARLDGTTFASETGADRTDSPPTTVNVGVTGNFPGANTIAYFDDLAVNDDQGANQNTWPGAGSVVLLTPTADTAVGTGWTLGTGTAISAGSGSTAVKNKPPLGVADLAVGSDPKQIRNASSNANSAYDATMTTYAAAGVPTGATVKLVDPIVVTAAPVTTSSKQGTVGVVSNPAITAIALGAAGTSGAFWSGTTAGTFPTGWKISHGTVTYAPTVTLGTAPVMRINQVTSSTRIAMVCFMGIYVDYTPAAPKSLVVPSRTQRNFLLRR